MIDNVVLNLNDIFINMRDTKMKARQFASGEEKAQPLDMGLFRYECEHVLGMEDLDEEELYMLARYLIEHYYLVPKRDRGYLRYSVTEA